jgi:hypothetical protein
VSVLAYGERNTHTWSINARPNAAMRTAVAMSAMILFLIEQKDHTDSHAKNP